MILTGWTPAELGSAPADVVRRLMWRIFVTKTWDPQSVAAARAPLPRDASLEAKLARADALKALGALERALWPEGD